MMIKKEDLTIIILAGGKSERMDGADKGLMMINNSHIIKKLHGLAENYSNEVYVNANRNIEIYRDMGLKVWEDNISGYQGPLAGMYTCLTNSHTKYLLTLPCDGPLVNDVYFERMLASIRESKIELRCAHNGDRIQPVYSLISKDLLESLKDFIDSGQRKIDKWFELCNLELVDFSDKKNLFININRRSDLIEYKELINKVFNSYE